MNPRVRPAARLARILAALAALGSPPVHANVTGNLEIQSHTTQNLSETGIGSSPSTLLMESLSLQYAGLPFGPGVAIAAAGGSVANSSGWLEDGRRSDAQVYTFGGSLGFLPRRGVPLRLHGSGTLSEGTGGTLATGGPGPTFLYGGALNLEPDGRRPGLRLDASEGRSSRPGFPDLSDVQRRLVGQGYGTVAGQKVDLALRLDDDHREGSGDLTTRSATLNVRSALHQTVLLATDLRRYFPTLAGITSDRHLAATSDQRWSPFFSSQLAGRLAEAGAPGARGTLGDARAALTWVPIRDRQQLTFSTSASAGFARTSSAQSEGSGSSRGAGARVGYSRPLGPVTGGVSAGTSFDTFQDDGPECPPADPAPPEGTRPVCGFGNEGTATRFDGTFSVSASPTARAQGQADYTLAQAFAPASRGGDRVEHRVRGTGRLRVGYRGSVHAGLSYDDAVRERVDIAAARASTQRERAVGGALGGTTLVDAVSLSLDARHVRGSVVTDGAPFVVGTLKQVRSVTNAQASAGWNPRSELGLQAGLGGSWTAVDDAPLIRSVSGSFSVRWRIGRLVLSAYYDALRVDLGGSAPVFQHSLRTVLARPFEL